MMYAPPPPSRLELQASLTNFRTMMFAATAAAIRLSVLPGRGAAAAATATLSSTSSSPCLSHLFNSQCNLSRNDGISSRSVSTRSRPRLATLCRPPSPLSTAVANCPIIISGGFVRKLQGNRSLFRSFASETDKGGDETTTTIPATDEEPSSISGSSQHDAWVEYQRSIAVSGFETGQTLRERKLGKKKRGGKMDRKRKEREAELEAQLRGEDITQVS